MNNEEERSSQFCDDQELAESALAGNPAAVEVVRSLIQNPRMLGMLEKRGASKSEADEIIADLLGDCFGGKMSKGGMYRLLGRYGGKGPLGGFLSRIALHRLISLKRQTKAELPIKDEPGEEEGVILESAQCLESEDAIMDLLAESIKEAFALVNQEHLVLFRMVRSYGISQKRVGEMWGWHESKISRALANLLEELRTSLLASVKRRDPWLQLEWEDFIALCGQSVDLFDY